MTIVNGYTAIPLEVYGAVTNRLYGIGATNSPSLAASIKAVTPADIASLSGFYRALGSSLTLPTSNIWFAAKNGIQSPDIPASPSLLSIIKPLDRVTIGTDVLSAFLRVVVSDQTSVSEDVILSNGQTVGYQAAYASPSLRAAIYPNKLAGVASLKARYAQGIPGEATLNSIYYPKISSDEVLISLIRVLHEGSTALSGFYRALKASDLTLTGLILPLPPIDLKTRIEPMHPEDIAGLVICIPPESLFAAINAKEFKPLKGKIEAFVGVDLLAQAEAFHLQDLKARIINTVSTFKNLSMRIQPIDGSGSGDLPAIVRRSVFSANSSVGARIYAKASRVLGARLSVLPRFNQSLPASIEGALFPDSLKASIQGDLRCAQLRGFFRAVPWACKQLNAEILPAVFGELGAEYSTDGAVNLPATIEAKELDSADLLAKVVHNRTEDLTASYNQITGAALFAGINSISPSDLRAFVKPKVVYYQSSIPITTFNFTDLAVVINARGCDALRDFSDLSVTIKYDPSVPLTGSYYAAKTKMSVVSESFSLRNKKYAYMEDWEFFVLKPSTYASELFSLTLTTLPFSDLAASIEAVPESSSLTAGYDARFFSGGITFSDEIGEWRNLKTGERRRLEFSVLDIPDEFIVFEELKDAKPLYKDAKIALTVESYSPDEENSNDDLLAVKQNWTQKHIYNLDNFATLDEAIKYGIMIGVGDMRTDLTARVEARGKADELPAQIDAQGAIKSSVVDAHYVPVAEQPLLNATISGHGSFTGISAEIRGILSEMTISLFTDVHGTQYLPELSIQSNGSTTIRLTPVDQPGSISISNPDLRAQIHGIHESTVSGTISKA